MNSTAKHDSPSPAANGRTGIKLAVLGLLLVGLLVGYRLSRDTLSLERLAQSEASLREYQSEYPLLVYAIAFLAYVLVTGLSLPGATVMTLTLGWYFGFWPTLLLVSFASTTGATIAFLLSRFLLRDTIQSRFAERLKSFNEALDREGAFYLFTLRLIPAVPFFVINVVMGLTRIRIGTFWWVSQIGMLAGTCIYVYAGTTIPNLSQIADPSQLRTNDVSDWQGLMQSIHDGGQGDAGGPAHRIWELLSEESRHLIQQSATGTRELDGQDMLPLVTALNELIQRSDLALAEPWQGVPTLQELPDDQPELPGQKALTSINRTVLVLAFPEYIRPPQPILSVRLIAAFVLLGVFPIAARKIMQARRRAPENATPQLTTGSGVGEPMQ